MAGVLTILNSKIKSESLSSESGSLSLYKSINTTKKSPRNLGENDTNRSTIVDQIGVQQSSRTEIIIDSVLSKDIQKLAQELRVNEDETYRLKELNNFRTPLKDILDRVDPEGYARFLENTIKKISSCLEVNFCGMEKDSPESPYFDEASTIAHKTLLRSLSALEILIEQGHGDLIKEQMDSGVLERLLENNNLDIQQKSMGLLKVKLGKKEAFETIMKHEASFSGEAKASFYEELSNSFANKSQHQEYIDSLATTLESGDPNTVLSVFERFPEFSVEKEKLSKMAQSLCRFQTLPNQYHNWKVLRLRIDKLKEQDTLDNDFNCL